MYPFAHRGAMRPSPASSLPSNTVLSGKLRQKFAAAPDLLLLLLILTLSGIVSACQSSGATSTPTTSTPPGVSGVSGATSTTNTSTTPTNTAVTPGTWTVSASTPTKLTQETAQALYAQKTPKTPVVNDTLTHPDNYGWDDYATQHTNCAFSTGAYHAKAASGFFSPCYAKATNFRNFIFQVQITLLQGHSGGIVFRANSQTDQAYQLRISTDGTYILNKFLLDSSGKSQLQTLFSGSNTTISPGLNQSNLLAVLVQENGIAAFVNKHYLASTQDTTYQNGQIGVYADSDAGPVEAAFNNAQVWNV